MFEAIPSVTTGFTLAAFLAAIAAWLVRLKILEKAKLLESAPEDKRAELVASTLEFFQVDTQRLTRQQQYDIAIQQIRARAQRFFLTTILVGVLALVAAGTVYALAQRSGNTSKTPFEMRDNTTGDAVRCALSVHYLADGRAGNPIAISATQSGQFELSGSDIEIEAISGFDGYTFHRDKPITMHAGRRIVGLDRNEKYAGLIRPDTSKIVVSDATYADMTNVTNAPAPDSVKFTCKNDTDYTIDLFFYRYFPTDKRPTFLPNGPNGPIRCNREPETVVWDSFGSHSGGVFYFFASVGGMKAELVKTKAGLPLTTYVLKSLHPQLVITAGDDGFTGEVTHRSDSTVHVNE